MKNHKSSKFSNVLTLKRYLGAVHVKEGALYYPGPGSILSSSNSLNLTS